MLFATFFWNYRFKSNLLLSQKARRSFIIKGEKEEFLNDVLKYHVFGLKSASFLIILKAKNNFANYFLRNELLIVAFWCVLTDLKAGHLF
jgi:hypothetical protein